MHKAIMFFAPKFPSPPHLIFRKWSCLYCVLYCTVLYCTVLLSFPLVIWEGHIKEIPSFLLFSSNLILPFWLHWREHNFHPFFYFKESRETRAEWNRQFIPSHRNGNGRMLAPYTRARKRTRRSLRPFKDLAHCPRRSRKKLVISSGKEMEKRGRVTGTGTTAATTWDLRRERYRKKERRSQVSQQIINALIDSFLSHIYSSCPIYWSTSV